MSAGHMTGRAACNLKVQPAFLSQCFRQTIALGTSEVDVELWGCCRKVWQLPARRGRIVSAGLNWHGSIPQEGCSLGLERS